MGNAGRKTVEEKYSINIWAPRLAELYKEIAEVKIMEFAVFAV